MQPHESHLGLAHDPVGPTGSVTIVADRTAVGDASVPRVSVLVPFLNEAGNLARLTGELRVALDAQPRPWEVLLIDDGSTDASPDEALAVQQADPRFRVVRLQGHFGKSAALAAGRDLSRGEILVTIDADLQDPPAAIPDFLAAIDAGHDVVASWRIRRKEPRHRRASSAIFNRAMCWMTGVPIHDMNGGLKAYRRSVLTSIHLSRGMHRFLVVFAHAQGFRVTELPVEHAPRHRGATKYGWWRYVETLVCIPAAVVLRHGPDIALRTMLRAAALMLVLGAALALCGWVVPQLNIALVSGLVLMVLATQLILCRLVAEVLFQLLSRSGDAPAPYRLADTSVEQRAAAERG